MPFSAQCYLPRRAFGALDATEIRARAAEMGVSPVHWEASTHKMPDYVPAGSVRVTCSIHVAIVLVECFRRLAAEAEAKQDGDLLIQCATAVKALFDAIDEARKP